jgi:hypothetical protein
MRNVEADGHTGDVDQVRMLVVEGEKVEDESSI